MNSYRLVQLKADSKELCHTRYVWQRIGRPWPRKSTWGIPVFSGFWMGVPRNHWQVYSLFHFECFFFYPKFQKSSEAPESNQDQKPKDQGTKRSKWTYSDGVVFWWDMWALGEESSRTFDRSRASQWLCLKLLQWDKIICLLVAVVFSNMGLKLTYSFPIASFCEHQSSSCLITQDFFGRFPTQVFLWVRLPKQIHQAIIGLVFLETFLIRKHNKNAFWWSAKTTAFQNSTGYFTTTIFDGIILNCFPAWNFPSFLQLEARLNRGFWLWSRAGRPSSSRWWQVGEGRNPLERWWPFFFGTDMWDFGICFTWVVIFWTWQFCWGKLTTWKKSQEVTRVQVFVALAFTSTCSTAPTFLSLTTTGSENP